MSNSRDTTRATADAACKGLAERVTDVLKRQPATLSGDDSGLLSLWDELCVQVQEEESFFWDLYVDTAHQYIRAELERLPRHEQEAIWLETDAGFDWLWDVDQDQDMTTRRVPIDAEASTHYVFTSYVVTLAEHYSSAAIDAFLERSQTARYELDRLPRVGD